MRTLEGLDHKKDGSCRLPGVLCVVGRDEYQSWFNRGSTRLNEAISKWGEETRCMKQWERGCSKDGASPSNTEMTRHLMLEFRGTWGGNKRPRSSTRGGVSLGQPASSSSLSSSRWWMRTTSEKDCWPLLAGTPSRMTAAQAPVPPSDRKHLPRLRPEFILEDRSSRSFPAKLRIGSCRGDGVLLDLDFNRIIVPKRYCVFYKRSGRSKASVK